RAPVRLRRQRPDLLPRRPKCLRRRRQRQRPLLRDRQLLQGERHRDVLRPRPDVSSGRRVLRARRRLRRDVLPVARVPEQQHVLRAAQLLRLRREVLPGARDHVLQRPVLRRGLRRVSGGNEPCVGSENGGPACCPSAIQCCTTGCCADGLECCTTVGETTPTCHTTCVR